MNIEEFVIQSEGEWKSMRSGHSLAFQQFEEIISTIKILLLPEDDTRVVNLIKDSNYLVNQISSPFMISWDSESNWEPDSKQNNSCGSSILIPIPKSKNKGYMLRSLGYSERIKALSTYNILEDGTLILRTTYTQTKSEERIWFISTNVRCRSSVIYSKESSAILQTSHASELRKLKI